MVNPPPPSSSSSTMEDMPPDLPYSSWQAVPRSSRVEVGDTGVLIFSGQLFPRDYNTEWSVPARYAIIDQMRNDPTIAGALRAIKLPLLRAKYYVDPPSDDAQQKEIAEWLEDQLFEYMAGTFTDFQRHALMSLDYGSYPHEIVLHVKDGRSRPRPEGPRICIEKLGPRHPASFLRTYVTLTNELDYIVQQRQNENVGTEVILPADKLLMFVNEQEGADFTGRSLLRPVYKPWWYKQGMEAVDAVAKEKRSMGIDVMEMEAGATTDDQDKAERALATIRSHQNNYLVVPKDRMSYRLEGIGAGSVLSTMETMEYHDLRILRAFFTEFLAMGPNGSGGLTQHEDKTKFLLMLVEAIGANFLDVINRKLIPRLVQYNWGPQEEYPRLCHGKIDVRDLGALADGLYKLHQAGFLHPRQDGKDEEFMRSMYDMPDAPPPEEWLPTMQPNPAAPNGQPVPGSQPGGNQTPPAAPQPAIEGSKEPPEYMSRVVNRQLESLRALAARCTDVNAVVGLSVPFKSEAATLIATHNGWSDPEMLIHSRTLAEVYAGTIKSRVVREWTQRQG